jgi:hypothetical protein
MCWPNIAPNTLAEAMCWPNIAPNTLAEAMCWPNIAPNTLAEVMCWPNIAPNTPLAWLGLRGGRRRSGRRRAVARLDGGVSAADGAAHAVG